MHVYFFLRVYDGWVGACIIYKGLLLSLNRPSPLKRGSVKDIVERERERERAYELEYMSMLFLQ